MNFYRVKVKFEICIYLCTLYYHFMLHFWFFRSFRGQQYISYRWSLRPYCTIKAKGRKSDYKHMREMADTCILNRIATKIVEVTL